MQKLRIFLLFIALAITFYLLVPHIILARHAKINTVALLPTPTIFIASPTTKILPTLTSKPTPTPTKKIISPVTLNTAPEDNVQAFIMNAINEYRNSLGLSRVTTNSETCSFAAIRAKEISSGFNHDGFSNRVSGHSLPYSTYHEVTENIAMTSQYKEVVNMWINSSGHAANMRKDTPYVCVSQFGTYYAYEGWRP